METLYEEAAQKVFSTTAQSAGSKIVGVLSKLWSDVGLGGVVFSLLMDNFYESSTTKQLEQLQKTLDTGIASIRNDLTTILNQTQWNTIVTCLAASENTINNSLVDLQNANLDPTSASLKQTFVTSTNAVGGLDDSITTIINAFADTNAISVKDLANQVDKLSNHDYGFMQKYLQNIVILLTQGINASILGTIARGENAANASATWTTHATNVQTKINAALTKVQTDLPAEIDEDWGNFYHGTLVNVTGTQTKYDDIQPTTANLQSLANALLAYLTPKYPYANFVVIAFVTADELDKEWSIPSSMRLYPYWGTNKYNVAIGYEDKVKSASAKTAAGSNASLPDFEAHATSATPFAADAASTVAAITPQANCVYGCAKSDNPIKASSPWGAVVAVAQNLVNWHFHQYTNHAAYVDGMASRVLQNNDFLFAMGTSVYGPYP